MKTLLIKKLAGVCFVAVMLSLPPIVVPAYADDTTLTNTEKANALREKARDQAKARLHRPNVTSVFDSTVNYPNPAADYLLLSKQIEDLAKAIKALGQSNNSKNTKLPLSDIAKINNSLNSAKNNLKEIYGPKGPTTKSVKLILEYRMLVADNPRLKIGDITEDAEKVTARVVTVDGSLVEHYSVNKRTGAWSTIR